MATAQSNNISKSEQITDYTNNVRSLITNATVWYTGGISTVGFPYSYLGGGQNPGGPSAGNLNEPLIDASTLAAAFTSWSKLYTRVRRLRFHRTGNLAPYDSTQVTHMTDSFRQSGYYGQIDGYVSSNGITAGSVVTASNFNSFVSNLYSSWNNSKNNTIYYNYYYCHSNCHSSCHSSTRWRR